MIKRTLFVATILMSTTVTSANLNIDGETNTDTIRVATFNIMASRMGDTEAIRDAIKHIDADIIGLQEVDNKTGRSGKNFSAEGSIPVDQAAYFAEKLNLHYAFCQAIEHDGGTYGHAILSKYPVKTIKKVELPNKDNKEQRVACAVEVNIPSYPAPVIAITAHLDHTDINLRLAQVRALKSNFSAWQLKHGFPIIIGDLNLPHQSNAYFELLQLFNETDKDLKLTAPSWNPDRKIDYILTSAAQEWDIENAKVPSPTEKIGGKSWYEITDHLPLIIDMSLTKK